MSSTDKAAQDAKRTAISYATDWGKSPLPPTLLATLITALHARPFQPLPMLFPSVLLFSTYLNLSSYVVDSAGITAAWSGLYLLMARRRTGYMGKTFTARLGSKYGARGLTRGAAMVLAGANLVGGGVTYAFGKGGKEEDRSV
ncbi:uncharacterized protein LY89DRAFT_688554 [Mollisia scopiformis]|uniref:Uncharacterized protein n=1 Tax=Mollisia scopiformis TaxID=149040 RepID=A0A194WWW5_MOLSC|nr:uncharacterized protein LY89DRAFT_688554 [Mollisia scopiformis]KUJ12077.1 hypothetical protein LY89DRAFT_688554 [Mollisia scopiformis]